MKKPSEQPRSRGRPRGFERSAALQVALRLFWQHGYDATSIADLSAAMGIAPASLYAAFGDKETLFAEVLDLYANGPASYAARALALPDIRSTLTALVDGAAEAFSQSDWPHGCLATLGDAGLGPRSEAIGKRMAQGRAMFHTMIAERIRKAAETGEIRPETEAEALADAVLLILFGVAVQARDGASQARLRRAGHIALAGVLDAIGPR